MENSFKLISTGIGLTVLSNLCAVNAKLPEKPNVIFILVDDMGWEDVGYMGNEHYRTPNIDQLASQGMIFNNGYANASNSAPSRACLLSGQYTPRHAVYTVGNSDRGKAQNRRLIPVENNTVLNEDIVTFAELFKQAGYVTGQFGKWHLGDEAIGGSPESQGFDINIAGNHKGHPGSYFSPYRNPNIEDGPEGEYLTDRLTTEVEKFITHNQNQPFMVYFPHYAVHTPLQAKSEMEAYYQENLPADLIPRNPIYAAMVESVDQSVGRITDKIDELGLSANTLIVFMSDNGGIANITNLLPLKGTKGTMNEGGSRVPILVKWPNVIKSGTSCDIPVIGSDFYATFLDILKLPAPNQQIDGESLLPLLTQTGSLEREAIFWHTPVYLERSGGITDLFRCRPFSSMRKGNWKIIRYYETENVEIFNLKEDIGERNNLAEKMPEKKAELLSELNAWLDKTNAPIPTIVNPAWVALLNYSKLPESDTTIETDNKGENIVEISGKCICANIPRVYIEIYNNGKLVTLQEAIIDKSNKDFCFKVNLPEASTAYKCIVKYDRFSIDNVDKIIDNIFVGDKAKN
jgi:arylsulfatase A-like enzyme